MYGSKTYLNIFKQLIIISLCCLLISQLLGMRSIVPSVSMLPTINVGDHIIINRLSTFYRYPKCGDIIIFKQEGKQMIKRVIGVSGDKIDFKKGEVYVNDVKLQEKYIKEQHMTFLPPYSQIKLPYKVPENSYFVMGDNRTKSKDSRTYGAIDSHQLIAIGAYKIWPTEDRGYLK